MHEDTVALLGACTAGSALTVSAIDRLLPNIKDHHLRRKLSDCAEDHKLLQQRACRLLEVYGGAEQAPGILAKSTLWLKTNTRLIMGADDTTMAHLAADHCDAAIRVLSKNQNRCCMAQPEAIDLTREIIRCRENLSAGLRPYL